MSNLTNFCLMAMMLVQLVHAIPPLRLVHQDERIRVLCPSECDASYSPVCGSNGQSFSNECELIKFACENAQIVQISHYGECIVCPDHCQLNLAPVCGSDGKSYANECLMRSVACETGFRIQVTKEGFCNNANFFKYNRDECRDNICHNVNKPVCGSDNVTYRNKCFLSRAMCDADSQIEVAQEGPCPQLSGNIEEETSVNDNEDVLLAEAQDELASVGCDIKCELIYQPVCADDGNTYSNKCFMNVQACLTKNELKIVNEGTCKGVEPILTEEECDLNCDLSFKPVCADDGETYVNKCQMELEACKQEKVLQVVSEGECEVKCNTTCTDQEEPVCGSDGITYANPCLMDAFACLQKQEINVQYEGQCV